MVARLRLAILAVSVSAISKAALRRRSLTLAPGTAVALGPPPPNGRCTGKRPCWHLLRQGAEDGGTGGGTSSRRLLEVRPWLVLF